MSWYKEYKEEWTEIIETVAAEEHRQTQMIEKDTIQSSVFDGVNFFCKFRSSMIIDVA